MRFKKRAKHIARPDARLPNLDRLGIKKPQVGKRLELRKGAGIAADLQLVGLKLAAKCPRRSGCPPGDDEGLQVADAGNVDHLQLAEAR